MAKATEDDYEIVEECPGCWTVKNLANKEEYLVTEVDSMWHCTCPGHQYNKSTKHIDLVKRMKQVKYNGRIYQNF